MKSDESGSEGLKFGCPVCGCSTEFINDPSNWIDMKKHLRKCPRCGSVLKGLGRIYTVVKCSNSLDRFLSR
jgi:hypothetical protein